MRAKPSCSHKFGTKEVRECVPRIANTLQNNSYTGECIWDLLCNDQSLSWRGRRRHRQYFIHLSLYLSPSRVIILSLLYTLAFYLFSRNYISTINLRAAYLTFVINSRPTSSFLYFFLPLSIPIRLSARLVSFCILRRCLLIIPPLEMPRG